MPRRRTTSSALILSVAFTAPAAAQSCPSSSWVLRTPAAFPAPRSQHGMVFDTARSRAVLFGGLSSPSVFGDTWEWNGVAGTWTLRVPTGSPPSPRFGHAMAFDSFRARTILFGGFATATLGDTWEWNGAPGTWTLRTPAAPPPPRQNAAIAYDPVRRVVVLFGGSDTVPRADTWEFDPTPGTWTQRVPATSPPARELHALAYDATRARVVLFGGNLADSTLWEWDPAAAAGAGTWLPRTASPAPSPRRGAGLVFDSARARIVLFGGSTGGASQNDTWEWNGLTGVWSQRAPAPVPGSRSGAGFVFDPSRSLCILNGGAAAGSLGDTWELSSAAPPSISQNPGNRSVSPGASTTFSVAASGSPPLAYQWRRAGVSLQDGGGLANTQTATLLINPVSASHAGVYDCIVSDGCGATLSNSATLTVSSGCPADFDHNGLIQPSDVALFVNTWAASLANSTLAGDFDNNGIIQPADIASFINAWFTAALNGC